MTYIDVVLPADWASAIVNNDYSSLTKDERYTLEDTMLSLGVDPNRCVAVWSNEFYTRHHDAIGVSATNCLTYSFIA